MPRWIWAILEINMHGVTEGRPSVHVWSLRNEGLLALKPGTSKDVTLWTAVFYIDHREWERYEDRCYSGQELQMTAELRDVAVWPPNHRTYALRWERDGVFFGS